MSELKTLVQKVDELVHQTRDRLEELERKYENNGEFMSERLRRESDLKDSLRQLRQELQEVQLHNQKSALPISPLNSAPIQSRRLQAIDGLIRRRLDWGRLNELPEEQRHALTDYQYTLEKRGLSGMVDTEGGFLVPPEMEARIYGVQSHMPGFRQIIQALPTSKDRASAITRGAVQGGWGRDQLSFSDQGINFGAVEVNIYDLKAAVYVSNNLLSDTDANLVLELSEAFGAKLAELEDLAFATGDGIEKPRGIFTNTALQSPTGEARYLPSLVAAGISDATNNGVDQLTRMSRGLRSTYRQGASWVMNSNTEAAIMNLKDQQGQYLWRISLAQEGPTTLIGKPIVISEGAPEIAPNAYPIAFGNFNAGCSLKDRQGVTLRMATEIRALQDQTAFLVKKRVGFEVVLPEAIRLMKCAVS